MAIANLRVLRHMKGRALAGMEAQRAKFYDPNTWPIEVCNGSYLDVDDILARSLPEVAGAQVGPVSGRFARSGSKTFAAIRKQRFKGIQQLFHRPKVQGPYSLELQEQTSE